MGDVLEERRVDGIAWARPSDGSQPWTSVPSGEALDLGVLLDGTPGSATASDGAEQIEVRFSDQDVLRSLSHIPSVGPTKVTVTVSSALITDIDLRLQDGAAAHLELSDYGQALVVRDPSLP
jgi:hypothetical protein